LEIYPASQLGQEAEFTPDSSLEQAGFELTVPLARCAAILDRLLHHSQVITIRGDS